MTAVVRFREVGLTYPGPPPVEALRPADVDIHAGEYVTVVGPSGSGKSTFLNVIGLLDRPSTGVYELDGIDTSTLSERDRAALRGRRLGFVFQAYHLLPHRTAEENVALAMVYHGTPARVRRETAREALDRVGLAHRAAAVPAQLSGGERQRVAIARGLVTRPSLLLCDEPTGNLDTVTAHGVLELIRSLWRERMTVLLVSHDPVVAAGGERTIEIIDGVLGAGR